MTGCGCLYSILSSRRTTPARPPRPEPGQRHPHPDTLLQFDCLLEAKKQQLAELQQQLQAARAVEVESDAETERASDRDDAGKG